MADKLTAPRGTRDLFGGEMSRFAAVENSARRIFSESGYSEIRTPIFESRFLFERSVGDETDIVKKELYVFRDKKDRELALRPEGTAGVVRAYIENNMGASGGVTKLWYAGPMFRYERPQGGRYRQFYQLGCEIFGAKSELADVEMVDLAFRFLQSMNVVAHVKINHLGCMNCKAAYAADVASYFSIYTDQLCPDCQVRLVKNPLRILDCKVPSCRQLCSDAPDLNFCEPCLANYARVRDGLSRCEIPYEMDHRLVRGLDYYTGAVFEMTSDKLDSQDAILGGGRYDNLVAELGGSPTPAVGFAIGIDRLARLIQVENSETSRAPFLYIIGLGDKCRLEAFDFTRRLRLAHLAAAPWLKAAEMAPTEKPLKAHLSDANKIQATHAVIIGENELERGEVTLRNMKSRNQEPIVIRGRADVEIVREIREKCGSSEEESRR